MAHCLGCLIADSPLHRARRHGRKTLVRRKRFMSINIHRERASKSGRERAVTVDWRGNGANIIPRFFFLLPPKGRGTPNEA